MDLPLWHIHSFCSAPFTTRVLTVLRGLIVLLLPVSLPELKKTPAWNQSGKPSTVPPPLRSTTTIAVVQIESSLGKRPLTQKPRRVETLPMWSQRKIPPMTTTPHIMTTATEMSPMGAVSTDTGSLGTVPGTWIASRTTMKAIGHGAGTNPRIITVTRMKGSPKNGMRLGSGTGMSISANDFSPFVFCFVFLVLYTTTLKLNLWGLHCSHMWSVLYILYCCCLNSNSMKKSIHNTFFLL